MSTKTLRELPEELLPLHRMKTFGAGVLSSAELLTFFLKGTKDKNPLDASIQLLTEWGSLHTVGALNIEQLVFQYGMTEKEAAHLVAATELGKRILTQNPTERTQLRKPEDTFRFMRHLGLLDTEQMYGLSLDVKNQVIGTHMCYKGSVHTSVVRVAEIFRQPILLNASGLILVHNHPSADPTPSPEDASVTREIVKMGRGLDIDVIDHVVIGGNKFVSLKERGLGF